MAKSKLIKGFFFLTIFLFFLLPPTDPDLGWHLRCGQEIWQNHTLCNKNQFSVLLPNYSWPNHFWLYQTILWPVYKFTGLWGLSFFNATLVTLAFFFFYQSIKNFAWEKILAIFLVIVFGWGVFSFGIRGQLSAFLFFNILLYLASQIKQKSRLSFFIPLVMLIWANTHGSVIIGLVLLFFFCVKQIYEEQKKFIFPVIIFASSLLITLLNPFGWQIYQEAWRHFAGSIDLSKLIAEWVPPNPHIWWLVLISGLGLLLYYLVTSAPKEIVFACLVLPFMLLALKARRHVHFHFTVLAYLFLTLPTTKNLLNSWKKQKKLREILAVMTTSLFTNNLSFKIA